MKSLFIKSLGAIALTVATVSGASAEPLRVGISAEPYPPLTYKSSSGDWSGFEVELAHALCAAMDEECVITPTGWGGIIPSLNSGKIDMIMNSMSITEERSKVINFTDPYYHTTQGYVGAKSLDFSSEDDLAGKTLAVQGSTIQASYIREKHKDSGAKVRIYDQYIQMIRDLQAGRIDLFLADQVGSLEFLDSKDGSGFENKATAPDHPIFDGGVGIGLRKDDEELRAKLNDAIKDVLEDGTCGKLADEFLGGLDVCGG